MDLAIQLLSKLLERRQIRVTFPDLKLTAKRWWKHPATRHCVKSEKFCAMTA